MPKPVDILLRIVQSLPVVFSSCTFDSAGMSGAVTFASTSSGITVSDSVRDRAQRFFIALRTPRVVVCCRISLVICFWSGSLQRTVTSTPGRPFFMVHGTVKASSAPFCRKVSMAKAMSSPVMSSTLHESSQMVSVMAASSGAGAVADAGVAVDAGAVADAGVTADARAVVGAVVAGLHAGCSGWFSAKLSPRIAGWFSAKLSPRIARTQLAAGKSFVPMP